MKAAASSNYFPENLDQLGRASEPGRSAQRADTTTRPAAVNIVTSCKMNTSTEREPTELRLHATHRKFIPGPVKQSPEWNSFKDGLNGSQGPDGIPPIFITPRGEIMDGRWRWERRRRRPAVGLHHVCIERPEEPACALLMAESLIGAKKMTRGAAVYLVLKFMPDYLKSKRRDAAWTMRPGKRRRRNWLDAALIKKAEAGEGLPRSCGDDSTVSSNSTLGVSVTAICERWGVHRSVFYQAIDVHRLFTAKPALRAEWEPPLLNGERNLWKRAVGRQGQRGWRPIRPREGASDQGVQKFLSGREVLAGPDAVRNRGDRGALGRKRGEASRGDAHAHDQIPGARRS